MHAPTQPAGDPGDLASIAGNLASIAVQEAQTVDYSSESSEVEFDDSFNIIDADSTSALVTDQGRDNIGGPKYDLLRVMYARSKALQQQNVTQKQKQQRDGHNSTHDTHEGISQKHIHGATINGTFVLFFHFF